MGVMCFLLRILVKNLAAVVWFNCNAAIKSWLMHKHRGQESKQDAVKACITFSKSLKDNTGLILDKSLRR